MNVEPSGHRGSERLRATRAGVLYTRALSDPVIGFIFTDVARLDLEAHVPRITSFWETILLGAQSYSGGAFRPHALIHARAPLRRGHFERWLWLWRTTVDELFAGPRAELAKSHAARVAAAFHGRLDAMSSPPGMQAIWRGCRRQMPKHL